jgi:hypothetical protein
MISSPDIIIAMTLTIIDTFLAVSAVASSPP